MNIPGQGLIVNKAWGQEEWLICTSLYWAKWLHVQAGYVCSEHRHRFKIESFHVFAGDGVISIQGKVQRVEQGDTVLVPVGQYHYFATQNGMTLLEVSTEHCDLDVERLSESHALDPERDTVILRHLEKEV